MAQAARLIKKYPNRRLYDTASSCYITLADVKQLVIRREAFQVLDAKSGEDLTRCILLQIILEEEAGGTPMFSHDVLQEFIRSYGNAMQGIMGEYLQRNIQAFLEFQRNMQQSATPGLDPTKPNPEMWARFMTSQAPAMQGLMSAYMEQSRAMLEQMQQQFQAQSQSFFANFQFPGFGQPPAAGGNGAAAETRTEAPQEEPR